ncbi:hypothetical protein TVAG_123870 [Trichomonas vaginalis G3]|uniref:Uncharacterized protein n=1 Tax=Trichomonas vaginalis (strain ATCC PRA-98 / G3) TaxID=412133 RepID=A2EMX9_TRIV3|nr:hypothetical protein TVAGG3_0742710 [Trichomonas vaginalis G3]EAY05964.1 hypothetical protein TVAG_123870 [Trichomonas vaginalis G3]KAI5511993.1 hypothetical protein TVAGG3_0742710 [Trichomonas vaginalis G3]|eukprot:XP_001318187.1 hypothetical protein [Trichomonas vaginalis G3]
MFYILFSLFGNKDPSDLIVLLNNKYTLNQRSSYGICLDKLGLYYTPQDSIDVSDITKKFKSMNLDYMLTRNATFLSNGTLDDSCEMGKFLISLGFNTYDFSNKSPYPNVPNTSNQMDASKMSKPQPPPEKLILLNGNEYRLNERSNIASSLANMGLFYKAKHRIDVDQMTEMFKGLDINHMKSLRVIMRADGTLDRRCQMAKYLKSLGFDLDDFHERL